MEKKKKVQNLSSVEDPFKVKVLILAQQKTAFQDFYFINTFTNVVKIDLSYNNLNSFPQTFSFQKFQCLKILFLHYNRFSTHKQLQCVCESQTIEYLTLFGNPLEQAKTRHFIINKIPSLKLMDDKIVKIDEKVPQFLFQQTNPISLKVPFPIVNAVSSQLSSSFLAVVIQELLVLRQKYIQANPLIKIQRWFRKMLHKKYVNNQIKLQTTESQKKIKIKENRLVTEKFQDARNNELKIISLLKMNLEFLNQIKHWSNQYIYVLKSYCEENQIQYESLTQYYCLRTATSTFKKRVKFISYFINSNNSYLVRKKGSRMELNRHQFETIRKLKIKSSKKPQLSEPNTQLSEKLQNLRKSYQQIFVRINPIQNPQIYRKIKKEYFRLSEEGKVFPMVFQPMWERNIAAISIQRLWKGYKVRKYVSASNILLRKTAAIKIQRWVRKLSFINRYNFMIDSYFYLKQQHSTVIVLQLDKILSLNKIYVQKQKGINFVFPEQRKLFLTYMNLGLNVCIGKKQKLYPPHFQNQIKLHYYNDPQTVEKIASQTLLTLLFKGSKKVSYQNKQAKIEYNSIAQAKNRKYLLALATYSFKTKKFIKSIEQSEVPYQKCFNKLIQQNTFIGYTIPQSLLLRNNAYLKIRYYHTKQDYTAVLRISMPLQFKQKSLPKPLGSQKSLGDQRSNYSSAKISQNVIKIQNHYAPSLMKSKRRYQDLDNSISFSEHENESIGKINHTQNMRMHDYSSTVHNSSENKKQKIKEIKNTHRERVEANQVLKQKQLKKIRKQLQQEQQKQQRSIRMNKIDTLMTNIKKSNLIRTKLQKKSEDFEKKFLSRGNSSIKKQMQRHEKVKKSLDKSSIHSIASKQKLITGPSKRYFNVKTQIKEFSINVSETDLNIVNMMGSEETENQLKPIKEDDNARFNSVENFEETQKSREKKKARKKKIVHSVFPEEFYPLKQTKKIGFQLPKINK